MNLSPFKLERYFAKYEFSAPYLLSPSDCEAFTLDELLGVASEQQREIWNALSLGYTESKGHSRLLSAIAAHYSGIDPQHILEIVPEEGIFLSMHLLVQPGDHVITTMPGYQSLYEIARSMGCEVSGWYPDSSNNWHFSLDDLKQLVKPNTKLLVVNFPHNPTGALPTAEHFRKIIEFARLHDLIVFSDEMYRFSEYDDADRLPAACEIYDNAVSLCGLSKSFGLPGLRVGWLITRNADFMQGLAK